MTNKRTIIYYKNKVMRMRCKDDEKQLKIKNAVIKLILAEGFHGVSISKIAKEAGVSPATVYVYYDSKETMLRDIYHECGEQIYAYILNRVDRSRGGAHFVESVMNAYFSYIIEYGEEFFFVEQFTSCPALVGGCCALEGDALVARLFDDLKRRQVIKNVNNQIIASVLFNPVKTIAVQHYHHEQEARQILKELVPIIQSALLLK